MKKGQKLPTSEVFTFKPGQQVALYSERKGLRMNYEFINKLERFYIVKNVDTGTEHRVWFNKVLSISEAKKKELQIQRELEQKLMEHAKKVAIEEAKKAEKKAAGK